MSLVSSRIAMPKAIGANATRKTRRIYRMKNTLIRLKKFTTSITAITSMTSTFTMPTIAPAAPVAPVNRPSATRTPKSIRNDEIFKSPDASIAIISSSTDTRDR